MRRLGVVAILAVIGCGGGDGDPLVGTWALQFASGCVVGRSFAADHSYEVDLICPLTSGGFGLQVESGTYTKDSARLNFSAGRATCAVNPSHYYVEYSLQEGPRLYLTFSDGVEVLTSFSPSGAAAATFGCFMTDGFHSGPLMPVP